MEKSTTPNREDVGSSPASSATLQKVVKVVCNSMSCRIESCLHFWPHEETKAGIELCTRWQFCSSIGTIVRCEKVVDN